MTKKRILGAAMLAIPVCALIAGQAYTYGVAKTLVLYSVAVAITVVLIGGFSLLFDE